MELEFFNSTAQQHSVDFPFPQSPRHPAVTMA